jgi:RecA-family ATPase
MSTKNNRRPTPGVETITLGRLLAHKFPPREPLVAPWLRQGESAMLWAAPSTGKTLLTLTIAVMVAGGGSVLGWTSEKPRKVLIVDGEMSAEDLQERITWLIETVAGIDREAAAA